MQKFTVGQPIPNSSISKAIDNFILKIKPYANNPQPLMKLKHKSHIDIQHLFTNNFLKDCIKYCLVHQLKNNIEGLDKFEQAKLSERLREFYFKMSAEKIWKKQFDFQQTIVCITKIISQFYHQIFTNVNANSKLQSEIFIVLVYTLMGIKVGTNCFQLLEKKYLKIKEKRDNESERERLQRLERLERRKTLIKRTTKDFTKSGFNVSGNSSCSFLMSNKKQQRRDTLLSIIDPYESMNETLKENLYVNPLPVIKKPKKSIQFFDASNFSNNEGRYTYNEKTEKSLYFKSNKKEEIQPRNKSLYSTQLSLALKSQINKRHVSIAEYTKSFKIKHRVPYNSSHLIVFKNDVVLEKQGNSQSTCAKDKIENKKMNSEQWEETVRNIKETCKQTECCKALQKSPIYIKQDVNVEILKDECCLPEKKFCKIFNEKLDTQETEKSSVKVIHSEKNGLKQTSHSHQFQRLASIVKNFKELPIDETSIQDEKPKKIVLNRKFLKQQKSLFDLQAKKRHQKIQYTMFMLPSMLLHNQTSP